MDFIRNETEQKLRGGYYTPPDLAAYVMRWILAARPRDFLEPSCGDGAFFAAIMKTGLRAPLRATGFELFPGEAAKARARCKTIEGLEASIHARDFLGWAIDRLREGNPLFDAAAGNPPFIRYQYLPESAQEKAETIFKSLGLPFTKHTNAWVPFVLASVALLRAGGRLGMILPAEVIHVMHAQPLRRFLGQTCRRLLITDPEDLWFEGTLQGAVMFFAEKKSSRDQPGLGLGIVRVSGKAFLKASPERAFYGTPRVNGSSVEGKWTPALLSGRERRLVERLGAHPDVHRFFKVARADVGIVTGANRFFLVPDAVVREFDLEGCAYPMFGRSGHCPGVIYDRAQHRENARKGLPTNFLWIRGRRNALPGPVLRYVESGEAQGLHTRYKCRIREPWYTVPSVSAAQVGLLKRSHDVPRLIVNRLGAYTTDTAYRISSVLCEPDRLACCFLNSLTALSAELEGRHYGGGVLELVPSEIERLLVPLPNGIDIDLQDLDARVRRERADEVLAHQDRAVLGALGVSRSGQEVLQGAWRRLRDRRQRVASAGDGDPDPDG